MRALWLLAILLLTACPAREPEVTTVDQTPPPDEYTQFSELLNNEADFYTELKRLQGLYSDPADPATAGRSDNDNRYVLTSKVADGRIGFCLLNSYTGEEWFLWALELPAGAEQGLNITRDEPTATGRLIEVSWQDSRYLATLTARWVNGRYLQITRELMVGGYDIFTQADGALTRWELAGPSLPYRCLPAAEGPFGVVAAEAAHGEWQLQNYPRECLAPMCAAYGREGGVILAVVDEHPRKLDRDYDISWRVDPGSEAASQLRFSFRQYDPTQDIYAEPYLATGLPLRDTLVLEPFALAEANSSPGLVEAETREVLRRMGVVVRAFHFTPDPPPVLPQGNGADFAEWFGRGDDADAFRLLSGVWGVNCLEADLADLPHNGETGQTGVAGTELLPVVARVTPGVDNSGLSDLHDPLVVAQVVRSLASGLLEQPVLKGYRLSGQLAPPGGEAVSGSNSHAASRQAKAFAVSLRSAEAIRLADPGAIITSGDGPRLALPSFCNAYIVGAEMLRGSSEQPSLALSSRLYSVALWELFAVQPRVAVTDGSLSAATLAMTGQASGVMLEKAMQQHDGFAEWSSRTASLRGAGGELLLVHHEPAVNGYTGGDEVPAELSELIAILPADLTGDHIWVAFHGCGGALEVDSRNNLTVLWPGGEWQGALPPGLWIVDHPYPDAVLPGDVALIRRGSLSKPGSTPHDRT